MIFDEFRPLRTFCYSSIHCLEMLLLLFDDVNGWSKVIWIVKWDSHLWMNSISVGLLILILERSCINLLLMSINQALFYLLYKLLVSLSTLNGRLLMLGFLLRCFVLLADLDLAASFFFHLMLLLLLLLCHYFFWNVYIT